MRSITKSVMSKQEPLKRYNKRVITEAPSVVFKSLESNCESLGRKLLPCLVSTCIVFEVPWEGSPVSNMLALGRQW